MYVLPALDMNVVPHLVEIDVGNQLRVPVRMTTRLHEGGEPVAFDDCRQVSLGVELGDAKNFQASANLSDAFRGLGCCTSVTLVASDVALTRLTLTLPVDADATVKSSVLVASYRPLRHLEPASGQTALALGSSRVLVFEGGPLPWVNKPSGHFRKGIQRNPSSNFIQFPERNVIRVTEPTEQRVSFIGLLSGIFTALSTKKAFFTSRRIFPLMDFGYGCR